MADQDDDISVQNPAQQRNSIREMPGVYVDSWKRGRACVLKKYGSMIGPEARSTFFRQLTLGNVGCLDEGSVHKAQQDWSM